MGCNLVELESWCRQMGREYRVEKVEDDYIELFTEDKKTKNSFKIFIRTLENGAIFQLQAEPSAGLDKKVTYKHTQEMLQQILMYNYNFKFGTWEYNKDRGDIRYAIEIPLEDSIMTVKQFKRILSEVYDNLHHISTLKSILEGKKN